MEENNKKAKVMLWETGARRAADAADRKAGLKERIRKPLIFGLMGIVCAGCLYLIFSPSQKKAGEADSGLNGIVPQAADKEMQADKEKAYEEQMLEEKQQQKRSSLTALSDYWQGDSTTADAGPPPAGTMHGGMREEEQQGRSGALNAYRSAQSALGSFYSDGGGEAQLLRKELAEVKAELAQRDVQPAVTVGDQMALMEKSYQMAAKYLPSGAKPAGGPAADTVGGIPAEPKKPEAYLSAIGPERKNTVSVMERKTADRFAMGDRPEAQERFFSGTAAVLTAAEIKNTIMACVEQTQTVTADGSVRLRLMEAGQTPEGIIPKGTVLTAAVKFQSGRLQLKVSSIEISGRITPVDISAYDLQGQQGLEVPMSQERTAAGQMAGNMGQQSATSLMLTQSAGQQVAADLSRGVLQGISGYFSKKVKTPKVVLKAGHQLYLVSKKQ
ncbi:conjugative transposon protein TraM [Flavobacterium plurextorum]